MEFRVNEAMLGRAAEKLTTLSGEVSAAESYNTSHVDLTGLGDSGIFVTAIGVLDQVRQAVDGSLGHLRELTTGSASELRATARQYRTTDDATDARMDRTYTAGTSAPSPQGPR